MRKNKLPVTLEPEEVQNLLKQPNKRYPTGLRNKAMMSLMLHCGLRLSEVINLKPGNLNLTKGKLRIESGKGKKGQGSCHTGVPYRSFRYLEKHKA